MNTRHVCEFLEFAKALNYTQAAKRLYISPTTLANHIHDLEDSIGVSLVSTSGTMTMLTPAGRLFAQEAPDIVSAVRSLVMRCGETNRTTLSLRLQSDPSISYQADLAAARATYEAVHECHVELQSLATGLPLRDSIRRGLVDFGFERGAFTVSSPSHRLVIQEGPYTCLRYRQDRIVFYARKGDAAACDAHLSAEAGAGAQPVVFFWTESLPARVHDFAELLDARGLRAKVIPRQVQDWSDLAFLDLDGALGACPKSVFDRPDLGIADRFDERHVLDFAITCDIHLTYDAERIDSRAPELFALLQESPGTGV